MQEGICASMDPSCEEGSLVPEQPENHPSEPKSDPENHVEVEIDSTGENKTDALNVDKNSTGFLRVKSYSDLFPPKENELQTKGKSLAVKLVEESSTGSSEFICSMPYAEEELQINYHFNLPRFMNKQTVPYMLLTLTGKLNLKIAIKVSSVQRGFNYWQYLSLKLVKGDSNEEVLSMHLPDEVLNCPIVRNFPDLKTSLSNNHSTFCFPSSEAENFNESNRKEFGQPLISYASKGNEFFTLDMTRTNSPFTVSPFEYILSYSRVEESLRIKTRLVVEVCLKVFKQDIYSSETLEEVAFTKSKMNVKNYYTVITKLLNAIFSQNQEEKKLITSQIPIRPLLKAPSPVIRISPAARVVPKNPVTSEISIAKPDSIEPLATFELGKDGIVHRKDDLNIITFPIATETCQLCGLIFPPTPEFTSHLYTHVSVSISAGIRLSNLKCDKCPRTFPNIPSLAEHKGLEHSLAVDTYKNVVNSLEKIPCLRAQGRLGTSFSCNNCTSPAMTIIGLLEHITKEHYSSFARKIINGFRNIVPTAENVCPFLECQRKVKSYEELTIHFGVDHMKVLDYYLKPIEGSYAYQVLNHYYQIMLPKINCVRDPTTCRKSFKSRMELNIHLCQEHFSQELRKKFTDLSKQTNTYHRRCDICHKNYSFTDGPIHLGVAHNYLEICLKESPITCDDDDEAQENTSAPIEMDQADASTNVTDANQTPSSQVIEEPKLSMPIILDNRTDSDGLWSLSCPECNYKFHFKNYETHVSTKFASHYFKHHRTDHPNASTLIKDQECLLCSQSFESLNLTIAHFSFCHPDALFDFLIAALPERNLSKYLIQEKEETKLNSTMDLYKKYLDFAKMKQKPPENMEPRFVNFFLHSSKNNLKLEKKQLVPVLQLISDCHIPLPDGIRLNKSPIFLTFTKPDDTARQLDQEGPSTISNQQKKKADTTHEPPVNSSTNESSDRNDVDNDSTMSNGQRKSLTCQKCDIDFSNVANLIAHVKSSNHDGSVLSCKFCNKFTLKVVGTPEESFLDAHLSAHTFSSEHLHNRFISLFQKERVLTGEKPCEGLWCEMCGSEIDLTGDHFQSQEHKQRTKILSIWVEFCDLREICPITCAIHELEFFFEITFPKTKSNNQKKLDFYILQVMMVCSNMHQKIDGVSLMGSLEMETLSRRIRSPEFSSLMPNFICFTCSRSEPDFQGFLAHLNNENHKLKCSRSNRSLYLKCEPCNTKVLSPLALCLHVWTSRHLECSWHYNNSEDCFISSESEPPVNFCSICSTQVDNNDDGHLSSEGHQIRLKCAESYLQYCRRNKFQPAEIGIEGINNFIDDIYRKTPRSQLAEADVALEVLNALHKPINGSKVNSNFNIRSFFNTCKAANSRQLSIFTDNMYDLLNEEQVSQAVTCQECYAFCNYATGMVFHSFSSHGISAESLLKMNDYAPTNDFFKCPTCKRNLKSPMSFALHVDMHHLTKEINCNTCKNNYSSPALYFTNDKCGSNKTISKSDRDNIFKEISFYIARSVSKEKGILPPSSSETNENRAPLVGGSGNAANRPPSHNPIRVAGTRVEGLRLIVSKIGGGELRPRPGVDPSCVVRISSSAIRDLNLFNKNVTAGAKRKEPETNGEKDGPTKSKRSCYSPPPQSPTMLMTGFSSAEAGFCLDCENCKEKDCDHENHTSRRIFTDISKHSTYYGHKNIKLLADCTLSKSKVIAHDLLYTKEWREKIRHELGKTRRKKSTIQPKSCKVQGCKFEASTLDEILRHVESHYE